VRFAVKVLVVVALFAVGVWILLAHAGLIIPRLAYQGFEAYGLPAGFGFIIAGVLVLWLWKIEKKTTTTTTTTTTHGDGGDQTTTTTTTQTTEESYAEEAPDESP
jgi:zinc transporter ZupT